MNEADSSDRPRLLLAGDVAARPPGLERELTRAGFRVSEGACPEAEPPPDAVLLSTLATDRDAVAGLLAACEGIAPRVVLSAATDPDLPATALALGADDAVGPPIHLPELCARIHARIRDARTRARGSGVGSPAAGPPGQEVTLDRRLQEEFERARRYSLSFSLILLAIEALDGAGERIAGELRRILRLPDFVSRYGDSEFAIVLPETDGEGARRSIARMRERLASLPRGALTAGIVSYPHPAATQPDDMFALVEAALARGRAVGGGVGVAD